MRDQTLKGVSGLTRGAGLWRIIAPLAVVTACLLLATVVINPFPELLSDDDGWAYARSVVHLIRTGEYKLDAWSAANMPVQIYLAAGLSKFFGYSLSLLRLTTVGFLALGLASFYGLARELGAARRTTVAATVALLASPLILLLSFTFMTDVQFLGWMLAALFLYVRGLRRGSDALVFVGSIAAAGAIGTRQFGLAIVGGLVVAWILSRRENRPSLRTMLLATALPACAAGWQIFVGLQSPNFTQVVRLADQRGYLGQPPAQLAHGLLWRSAIVLQYAGISVLPALPLLLGAAFALGGVSRRRATRLLLLTVLIGLALCAILLTGKTYTSVDDTTRPPGRLWPALGLDWVLTERHVFDPLRRPIDLAGIGAAAVLGAVALSSAQALSPIRHNRPETILLLAIPACLLGLHLIYVQLVDTYIVSFVPFALLLLAVQCRGSPTAPRLATASLGVSLSALLLVSLSIRGEFAPLASITAAADRLTNAGVPAAEISASAMWNEYHGAFDDWLAAGHPGYDFRPHDSVQLPFSFWLEKRDQRARYRIQDHLMSEPGWELIASDSYRGIFGRRHEFFTYQAVEATPPVR